MTPSEHAPDRARAALVLLAAGSGTRAGHGGNKVYMPLAGRPVFCWSVVHAAQVDEVVRICVVVRDAERAQAAAALAHERHVADVDIVTGGSTRHASEWAALRHLSSAVSAGVLDVVVVHDAARPMVTPAVFRDVIASAHAIGGAVLARDEHDLVPLHDTDQPTAAGSLVSVQTPQAFRAGPLLAAYATADQERFAGTDTASCFERYADLDIVCLPGPATNIKITYAEDLVVAERLLRSSPYSL